jgi:hypothetical protein
VSPQTIALVVVALSILLWAAFMANLAIRRNRAMALATAEPAAAQRERGAGSAGAPEVTEKAPEEKPKPKPKPLTPEQMAVSRRQFLNRAWTASFTAFLGFFGMASLSFLWPKLTGGFGTQITAGNYEDLLSQIGPEAGYKPLFIPEGRFWLVYYEGTAESPVYLAVGAKELKMQALAGPRCCSSAPATAPSTGSPASTSAAPRRAGSTVSPSRS